MQSTFQTVDSRQAMIQNTTAIGHETLLVTLHPNPHAAIEIEIREDTGGADLVSSSMSINQDGLRQLVQWLHDQEMVD